MTWICIYVRVSLTQFYIYVSFMFAGVSEIYIHDGLSTSIILQKRDEEEEEVETLCCCGDTANIQRIYRKKGNGMQDMRENDCH
jgi:putative component of toxin-antitoxin plasmid stabilization module